MQFYDKSLALIDSGFQNSLYLRGKKPITWYFPMIPDFSIMN